MRRPEQKQGLRWFGAWKKSSWTVREKREAYASGRGGRYQIQRYDEEFVVRYRSPYDLSDLWQGIGTAATQEEAIALVQAHNENPDDPSDAPQISCVSGKDVPLSVLRRETWQEWHGDVCFDVTLRCDHDNDPFLLRIVRATSSGATPPMRRLFVGDGKRILLCVEYDVPLPVVYSALAHGPPAMLTPLIKSTLERLGDSEKCR
jgi:hypothetical protein